MVIRTCGGVVGGSVPGRERNGRTPPSEPIGDRPARGRGVVTGPAEVAGLQRQPQLVAVLGRGQPATAEPLGRGDPVPHGVPVHAQCGGGGLPVAVALDERGHRAQQLRAARVGVERAEDGVGEPARTAPAEVGGTAEATGTAGTGGTTTAVAERVEAPTAPARRLGARSDAACHAAMSLGMVVMLAAMVAGW